MTDSNFTQQDPEDGSDEWLARQFQIDQTLAHIRTIVQVKVIAVQGGGVGKPPTVTVQPLVKIIDGQNNVTSHGQINNIPVTRIGCGNGSIIADPIVGDVGWMAVGDRDNSVVMTTAGSESQPGSRRTFDLADGIYIGKLFGDAPAQYVQFTESGIVMKSGTDGINLNGLVINQQGQVDGNLPVTGALELGGAIDALDGSEYSADIKTSGDVMAGTISLKTHKQTGVTTGGGTSGPPTP